ncbi:MAG: HDOD domain-containing protein [Gammaproteobacteria bacterium]
MNSKDLVANVAQLVSLPEVCFRVNEMLNDPNVTSSQLGRVIRLDPALTARLLRIVNSALYGFQSRIDTVSQAVTIIGLKELRSLVMASSAYVVFNKIPTDLVDMDSFWHHSVYTGLVARNLAEECRVTARETIFLAGLMHDVGQLVIYSQLPEQAAEILRRSDGTASDLCAIEREVLGFDHTEVSSELLQLWDLPTNLWEPIRYHHAPREAKGHPLPTALLHIANAIANTVEPIRKSSTVPASTPPQVDPLAWEISGLTEAVVDPVVRAVNLELLDVLEVICPASNGDDTG